MPMHRQRFSTCRPGVVSSQPAAFAAGWLAATILAMLLATAAVAQTIPTAQSMTEQTDAIVNQLEKLSGDNKLTAAQLSQVETILHGNTPKFQAAFTAAGVKPGDNPSLGQKIELEKAIGPIRNASDEKLANILSTAQMAEFKKIRKEVSGQSH